MRFKKLLPLILLLGTNQLLTAQIYIGKTCEISFSAPTPVEDIAAINSITKPLLNISTGDLQLKIVMTSFIFEKPLMQEHFNENYVESEKYPNAFFKGKINQKIDLNKDGVYKVSATGKLTIHGVEQERTIDGTITIMDKEIKLSSDFKILFSDYKIDIPALYSGVIPPDAQIKIIALLEPFKKQLN